MLSWTMNLFRSLRQRSTTAGYYARLYDRLIQSHEREGKSPAEARREAVGGDFEAYGQIERDALLGLGFKSNSVVVDLGCGAGRLARKLQDLLGPDGSYLGLDVNPSLLEEARRQVRSAPNALFRFEQVDSPIIPAEDRSIDLLSAFSVVTHIELEDAFSYFREATRVLKPDGRAIVSYLSTEIEDHWRIFLDEAALPVEERSGRVRNHVMAPGTLNGFAEKAGLIVLEDIAADHPWIVLTKNIELDGRQHQRGEKIHLGQSCLILKPSVVPG